MEPLEPLKSANADKLAVACGVLMYLFPSSDLGNTMARVLCLAHKVLPELYDMNTKVKVANILGVSPQAVNQMMARAEKSLASNQLTREKMEENVQQQEFSYEK